MGPKAPIDYEKGSLCNAFNGKILRDRSFFLSMVVLYKPENSEHDAKCSFITVAVGKMSLIVIIMHMQAQASLLHTIFFFFFLRTYQGIQGFLKIKEKKAKP